MSDKVEQVKQILSVICSGDCHIGCEPNNNWGCHFIEEQAQQIDALYAERAGETSCPDCVFYYYETDTNSAECTSQLAQNKYADIDDMTKITQCPYFKGKPQPDPPAVSKDLMLTEEEIKATIDAHANETDTFEEAVVLAVHLVAKAQLAKIQPRITELENKIAELENIRANRPQIVCLCGSTRFVDTYNEWRKRLTYEGKIVLSIEIVTTQSQKDDPQFANTELKVMLDELHKRKIDLADEVLILNVGGYIGESTRSEIKYAEQHGKTIKYLEAVK